MREKWYCVKCGRNHVEGGQVAWHHHGLKPDRTVDFEPETVAVGIAMADACESGRSGNRAALGDIEESYGELGLRRAFPDLDVRDELYGLKNRNLIGRTKFEGKERFEFLANRGRLGKVCSPQSFGRQMKDYGREYERAAIR